MERRLPHMDSALEKFHDSPRTPKTLEKVGHFLTDQMHYEPAPAGSDHYRPAEAAPTPPRNRWDSEGNYHNYDLIVPDVQGRDL